jgi:formylglycine-generating enzyme required for sulfatase activity
LPTEAQWEYACRAGSTGRWCSGDNETELDAYGWHKTNSEERLHLGGQKKPNAWGLYDMHGNVFEFCADWYDKDYYKTSPENDPLGPLSGSERVVRGGEFGNLATDCRCASRGHLAPTGNPGHPGFRVCLVLADTATERPKMSRSTSAAQPSGGSTANKASPAVVSPDSQSPIPLPAVGSLVGADGKWQLPPGAPPPAIAPFDAQKAKEHQEGWAKHLGVPVEMSNLVGMKLVLIPPGEFTMGEGDGAHKVRITKAFYLGKYEVTQEEWEKLLGKENNPSQLKGPKNPVEQVSWDDCQVFLKKLSEKCGLPEGSYRLPTEAQWEYACRAGSTSGWFFGENEQGLDEYAWYDKNSEKKTHPVGQKKPNAWGLYDICGNVWEWCADWHDENYYKVSPHNDPPGPTSGSHRVRRGGSWLHHAGDCRSALRDRGEPGDRGNNLGFRVSLVLPDTVAERAKMSRTSDAVQLPDGAKDPAFKRWMKDVAALPAEKQVEAVAKKLQELNPGFDGKVTDANGRGTPLIENGVVKGLGFSTDNVIDISPVRALAGLKSLQCDGSGVGKGKLAALSPLKGMLLAELACGETQVSDLSPLIAMPLTRLECGYTQVSDLSPLNGMPLTDLACFGTRVSDLSPLHGMPLAVLACDDTRVSDLSPLKETNLTTVFFTPKNITSGLEGLRARHVEPLARSRRSARPSRDRPSWPAATSARVHFHLGVPRIGPCA